MIRLNITVEIGDVLITQKDYPTAIHCYMLGIEHNCENAGVVLYNISCCYSMLNNKEEAIKYIEQAFIHQYTDLNNMKKDTDIDNIRNTKEFKALMKKYFPNYSE